MLIPQELQLSPFLKKLEEFSENFKVFSKGTLQPFIIALNFHISFINRGLALF